MSDILLTNCNNHTFYKVYMELLNRSGKRYPKGDVENQTGNAWQRTTTLRVGYVMTRGYVIVNNYVKLLMHYD